jgi:hypothetical protein
MYHNTLFLNINPLINQRLSNWHLALRRVWRYQRGNQNPYIEEEQTSQWPKEKVQKDKQRSTKHTHTTKDRVTRTPLKTDGELRCFGRVRSSCFTSHTRHDRGKDLEVFTTSGTYPWSFVTQIFHNVLKIYIMSNDVVSCMILYVINTTQISNSAFHVNFIIMY